MEDDRIGRFFSPDPKFRTYPFYSSYQFAGNTPIQAIDLDGKEPASLPPPGNLGYTTIYLASDHMTRNVGANETMANSSPNANPNGIPYNLGYRLETFNFKFDQGGEYYGEHGLYNLSKDLSEGLENAGTAAKVAGVATAPAPEVFGSDFIGYL